MIIPLIVKLYDLKADRFRLHHRDLAEPMIIRISEAAKVIREHSVLQ